MRSNLVQKHITDKIGRRTTKWVKLEGPAKYRAEPKHDAESRKEVLAKIAQQRHTSKIMPLFQAFGLAVVDNSRYGHFEMTLIDINTGKPVFTERDFFHKFLEKGLKHIVDNNIPMQPSDFDMDGERVVNILKEIEKDGQMTNMGLRQYFIDYLMKSRNSLKDSDILFDYGDLDEIPQDKEEEYKRDFQELIGRKNFIDGVKMFSYAVNRTILGGNTMKVKVSFPHLVHKYTNGERGEVNVRAYAQPKSKKIAISSHEDPGTIAHELTHILDQTDPVLKDKVKAYYHSRTKDEKAKWLGAPYGKHEITKEDEWMSPYIGKVYRDGATEVLSMWFTEALRDPVKFSKLDPDHFKFGYEILKGLR